METQRDTTLEMTGSNQVIRKQFGANAVKYETSPVHAHGEDLNWIIEAANLTGMERVLDVGTGTGHTALALASSARTVIGIDLTPRMVESAAHLADNQGAVNVQFAVSDVVSMPFPDRYFDAVTCRLAAHHFVDADSAAAEIARVLRPGGQFLLVDHVAPEDPELDRFVNRIDWLWDASHVREWTVPEWVARFEQVGIALGVVREWDLQLNYEWWIRQAATPADRVAEIERMFLEADDGTRRAFAIVDAEECGGSKHSEESGVQRAMTSPLSFALKAVLLQGVKHG